MFLLALVGIVFAVIRWRRHPGVSALTAIAFVLYIIKSFAFTALFYWLPDIGQSLHISWESLNTVSTVLDVVNDIFFAIVLLMLVMAAFSKRVLPVT